MSEDGDDICEAELVVVDGEYACPEGHRLARWSDLTQWTRDHIAFTENSPASLRDIFEPKGDRG